MTETLTWCVSPRRGSIVPCPSVPTRKGLIIAPMWSGSNCSYRHKLYSFFHGNQSCWVFFFLFSHEQNFSTLCTHQASSKQLFFFPLINAPLSCQPAEVTQMTTWDKDFKRASLTHTKVKAFLKYSTAFSFTPSAVHVKWLISPRAKIKRLVSLLYRERSETVL